MSKKIDVNDPRIVQMIETLKAIKIRIAFIGWPKEAKWNAGTEEEPHMIPDWRNEIALLEKALEGANEIY